MQQEGQFDLARSENAGEIDLSKYIHIENNGSDVTIFSFAGAAVLFAGMPQFEFRKLLAENGRGYNLVFLRDPNRSAFTKAPDGSNDGLQWYQKLILDAMEECGSRYNIALGASAGGAGAFFLSSRMPFHQIISFSPAFPADVYTNPRAFRRTVFNLKKLATEPKAYFEVLFVTLGAMYVWRTVCKTIGSENIPDITRLYLDTQPQPARATIFYGERCAPDTDQALRHQHIPTIHLRPINSGRHNCAADLKKRGQLGGAILEEIDAGLAQWHVQQPAYAPAYAQAEG